MSFPYLTISSNTSSLNSGSFYTENDLYVFNVSQSTDTFFGKSNEDSIEFSVFDINGNLNSWNILPKNNTYSVLTGDYKDVDQNSLSYKYFQLNSGYTIATNRKILLNTLNDLSASGVISGSQVVSYNFVRNVAGTNKFPLIIKSISADRKELELIPSFNLNDGNPDTRVNYTRFVGFSKKAILINDILEKIITKLSAFNASEYYIDLSTVAPDTIALIKSLFGFKTDSDIIQFLNDIYTGYSKKLTVSSSLINHNYDGIKTYITNWLYTNYMSLTSGSSLNSNFKYIVNKSVDFNLTKLNYNYKTLDVSGSVQNFIDSIYYDNFISPTISSVLSEYENKYLSYLKNGLNFGNGRLLPILNHSFAMDGDNITLVVKLHDYVPQDIGIRDRCWVSNIAMNPIIQKVIVTQPIIKPKYKIAGPNFAVNPKINSKPTTKQIDYTNKNQLNSAGLSNQIEFNKKLQALSVDYTKFENFVLFSNAELRVKLFSNKLSQLNALSSSLVSMQSNASTNSFISASYTSDFNSTSTQINAIYQSFDGYESYLYANQDVISGSAYQNYLTDAIEYDRANRDSLMNNAPEYIKSDDENSEYLVFLSMAGHFFDNIYLYIQNFPTTQYLSNASSNSFICSIANNLLEQFGWNPISSVDNTSLEHYYLTNSQYSGSNALSKKTKMDIIWSRLLNNLPMIYKTKGTEESIRLLANVYGVPYSFLNIKEFGGNSMSTDDNSSYSFDRRVYLTKFQGNSEYIGLPYTDTIKSIEFKFSIDSTVNYIWNDRLYLLYKDSDFSVYIDKSKEDLMGILTFKLHDKLISTDPLPYFNGEIYNVLIQQQPSENIYSSDIPSMYHLQVNSVDGDRIVFSDISDTLLNSSYETYFKNGSYIYFGNTFNGNNNFYGTLDKINLWNTVLSNAAFIDHCKSFDSYDDYDPENTYVNLYFRYGFSYPTNLALSQSTIVPNNSDVYESLVGTAVNFPNSNLLFDPVNCVYYSSSIYPFQFEPVNLTQNVTFSSFGPNKFKNSKINKVNQNVLARLMPTELSTTPINVNNNSNLVAAYVSPYETRDNDMLNFIGNYDIMNIIGDPAYLHSSSYDGLDELVSDYTKFNSAEPVLYQEFFTIYKNYIDPSFFDSVKQLVPARSKLIVGTLIEQSILERNKYQNKPIDAQSLNFLVMPTIKPVQSFTGTNIDVIQGNANAHNNGNVYDKLQTKYFSDDKVSRRMSAMSINGNCFEFVNGQGFVNNYIFKESRSDYYFNYMPFSSSYNYVTGSENEYNFTQNSGSFADVGLDVELYPKGHYALRYSGFGRVFVTDSTITVNESGSLDGSSPFEMTSTNQDTSAKKLVSI